MKDWKALVGAIAPGLATALGGPLAGGAVAILADKLLGPTASPDPVVNEARISSMLAGGVTPELREKIVAADNEYRIAVLNAATEAKRIDAETDRAVIADTQDARRIHSSSDAARRETFLIGVGVLVGWVIIMAGTLWGLFLVLTGRIELDIAIVATVFTVMGSIIGYVSSNAQQVISYHFGSSRGSKDKDIAMSDAISAVGRVAKQ